LVFHKHSSQNNWWKDDAALKEAICNLTREVSNNFRKMTGLPEFITRATSRSTYLGAFLQQR